MRENLLAVPTPTPPPAGLPVAYPHPGRELTVKLALRRQPLTAADTAAFSELLSQPPHLRRYRTHAEVAAATGGYPDDAATLEAYFAPFGVSLKSQSLLLGTVVLTGTVAAFERAFYTELALFQAGAGQAALLAAQPGYYLPASLLPVVQEVVLLQSRVRKESRRPTRPTPPPPPPAPDQPAPEPAAPAPLPGYSLPELAQAYQFPAGVAGEGQVIGFVELGGRLNQADLRQFFAGNGLKKPKVVEVGAMPAGSNSAENNGEVALDIQVAGALAPQARLVVYYGTTLIEALQAIVSDEVNQPTVVSISWAGSEYNYSAAEAQVMNLLIYQASLLGITLVAASADHGAYNNLAFPNVSLPASSPLVLGCGGTIATVADAALASEVVWNELSGHVASGGGYSALYAQPYYQQAAVAHYPYQRSPMRGVPDVAADASILTGYRIVLHGQPTAIGGTSGATPFVTALLALVASQRGYRLGFLNGVLYGWAGSAAFRPIVQGHNNLYAAAPYWNPCTGLGSLVGTELLALLTALEQAMPAPAPADPAAPPNEPTAPPTDSAEPPTPADPAAPPADPAEGAPSH
jgi:subtilase family serine protease